MEMSDLELFKLVHLAKTEHDIPPENQGGVVTVGKLKAREIEVSGNITIDNELTGFDFLDLGDTPSTYENKTGQFAKVGTQNGEPGLVFSTIDKTDITNFNTEVNNLIESNENISYGNIDGTPNLATVATTGSYNDLSGRPTIPVNTNTTYQLKATRNNDGSNTGGDNFNPYLHLQGTDGNDDNVRLVGSGSVTVTRNNNGQVTINGTDTNTISPDVTSTSNNQNIRIKNSAPTIFMIDNNDRNAYLRVDGNIFYILAVLVRLLGDKHSKWKIPLST